MSGYTFLCLAFVIICLTNGQTPPRLSIPGAVLVSRPPQRLQRIPPQALPDPSQFPPTRLRKPSPNIFPAAIPIREEAEESNIGRTDSDDEAPRQTFAAVIPQPRLENDNEDEPAPRPIQFRPERPLPVLRQEAPQTPQRAVLRQTLGEEPARQPISQTRRVVPQPTRQTAKPQQRPHSSEDSNLDDPRRNKNRKPVVQILRKYRTDNDDGSITWGFENEDGTFKEETIGTDCIIRGKYGYIDPEGTKREYSYESGNKCDQPEEELPAEEPPNIPQNIPNRSAPVYVKRPVFKAPLQA